MLLAYLYFKIQTIFLDFIAAVGLCTNLRSLYQKNATDKLTAAALFWGPALISRGNMESIFEKFCL